MLALMGGDAQGDEQMLLDWLKKDFAKDVAAIKTVGTGLAKVRAQAQRPAVAAGLLVPVIAFAGELLSSGGREASRADEFDYIGDQWATHGHSGPFGQWTED